MTSVMGAGTVAPMLEILIWPATIIICSIIVSAIAALASSERVQLMREQDERAHAFAVERANERSERRAAQAKAKRQQMELMIQAMEAAAPALEGVFAHLFSDGSGEFAADAHRGADPVDPGS